MREWLNQFIRTARTRARSLGACAALFACACESGAPPAAISGERVETVGPLAIAQAVSTAGAAPAQPSAVPAPASAAAPEGAAAAEEAAAAPALVLAGAGDYAVGTVRVLLDVAEGRRIPVQLWYPALESAREEARAGHPVAEFEPSGSSERSQYERLVRDADPKAYTVRTMHAAQAPAVLEAPTRFPLIVASHCDGCLRFAYFTAAERLASHGFVVAAPDHVRNTLYNVVAGNSTGVDLDDFLDQRRHDVLAILDAMLDPNAAVVPEGLRGKIDAERIGMFGHSYGALTTALTSSDPRIRAVAFLAMIASSGDNLPYAGDALAQRIKREPFSKPSLFVLAQEDVIGLFGVNDLIRENFTDYPKESWLATISDTGHYSVCTLCGIRPEFANCSGTGPRATNLLLPFEYLDLDVALDLTSSLLTTFFESELLGTSSVTLEDLATAAPKGTLTVEHHR